MRKVVGDSGEVAIDCDGAAARFVSGRILQCCRQFFLLSFQRGDLHFEFVHALFFFTLRLGDRIARLRFQTFLRFLLAQTRSTWRRSPGTVRLITRIQLATLAGFPVYVARLPPAPWSILQALAGG